VGVLALLRYLFLKPRCPSTASARIESMERSHTYSSSRDGRRPRRFGVEGVLAQTHTPEESYFVVRGYLFLTGETISKDVGCNNPQMGDFVLPMKRCYLIFEKMTNPLRQCFVQLA